MAPKDKSSNEQEFGKKMDQLIKLMEESNQLKRVALLEDGHIFRFFYAGERISMSLPDAQHDHIQWSILRHYAFYERRLLRRFAALDIIKPGNTVYDVGANIGNHSVFFGKVLGAKRIVAFEPQEHCHEVLSRNIELNDLDDAVAVKTLVGAKAGKGALELHRPTNLGAARFKADKSGSLPVTSLDAYAKKAGDKKIDFIKIDVEGMQMEVLEGAKSILKTQKPTLWIELFADQGELEPAVKWLADYGYAPAELGATDFIFRAT